MSHGSHEMNGHRVPTYLEVMAYQATREPWSENIKYGRYTLYFCAATIALFSLLYAFNTALFWSRMRRGSASFPFKSKIFALARLSTYPRLPYGVAHAVNYVWAVGPLGPNILLFLGLLYASLYCWANPYLFRPPFYGSPPVGLRSEWICVALIPFVFVLGSKRNVISWLTGVSHDKLQVFHQGVAFIVVYMAVVHGVTEVAQSLMERPFSETYALSGIWWTGFAALGPLLWLWIGSLPFVRKRLYEGFYVLHIIASILFVGFLYVHGFDILDTNAYMNATLALFGFGIGARIVMMIVTNAFFSHKAQISIHGDLVRATIPTKMNWAPGTHVFLRFLHIRPLESHPFTILSIPSAEKNTTNEMVIIIQAVNGFTRVLAEVAATAPPERKFPVILDGPYGHGGKNTLRAYETVLLFAGGTGVTFVAPLLEDLTRAMHDKDGVCTNVELVWAVKTHDTVKLFESELVKMKNDATLVGGTVTIRVFVTGGSGDVEKALDSPSSDKMSTDGGESSDSTPFIWATGRPDIRSIIAEKGKTCTGHVGVAVCGPLGVMTDTANAVSAVQMDILRGGASCAEMYLRSESFGW